MRKRNTLNVKSFRDTIKEKLKEDKKQGVEEENATKKSLELPKRSELVDSEDEEDEKK